VLDTEVSYALIPLSDGDAGFMPNHAPMLAALKEGVIKYRSDEGEGFAAISGGTMSLADNELIVLARSAEKAETIDLARAMEAEKRARERLAAKTENIDIHRAELSLARALAREKAYLLSHH